MSINKYKRVTNWSLYTPCCSLNQAACNRGDKFDNNLFIHLARRMGTETCATPVYGRHFTTQFSPPSQQHFYFYNYLIMLRRDAASCLWNSRSGTNAH